MVIAVGMRRGLDIEPARQRRIVVHEDPLPRHLDVVEHHHRVGLVEAEGEGRLEFGRSGGRERLARPQRHALGVAGHREGDGLRLRFRRQRQDVADPDFVGECRAGRQHLHAGNDDAVVLLADHAAGRIGQILLLEEIRIARGLRRHDGVRGEDVVVAHEFVIAPHIVGILPEQFRLQVHAGDEARDVIRRTAEQPEIRLRQHPMRIRALRQLRFGLRLHVIDRVAVAVLFIGQRVALRRIALEIEEIGEGARGVAEGGVVRHVVHALAADIDHAAVAQRFQIVLAGFEHGLWFPKGRFAPIRAPGTVAR